VQGPSVTSYRHHIRARGRTVAIYSRGSNGATNTIYPLADHLGSAEAITNSAGAVLVRASFDAFGKRRGSAWQGAPSSADLSAIGDATRRGYTEHSMLDNLGLIHMNGRVQDPELARFVSADPYIDGALDTQGWNRYSYVKNNPLTFTDPSGFDADDAFRLPGFVEVDWGNRRPPHIQLQIRLYDSIARRFANNLPPPNPVPNTNTVLAPGTLNAVGQATAGKCDMGPCTQSAEEAGLGDFLKRLPSEIELSYGTESWQFKFYAFFVNDAYASAEELRNGNYRSAIDKAANVLFKPKKILSKIQKADAAKRPGTRGHPDHQRDVAGGGRRQAEAAARPGETVVSEGRVQGHPGVNRRADNQVIGTDGRTRVVVESERRPGGSYHQNRTRQMEGAGIEVQSRPPSLWRD
jgi:RHS repeat-associated protein